MKLQIMLNSFKDKCAPCPVPLNAVYQPDVFYGSINERLSGLLKSCNLKKKSQRKEFHNMLKLKAMQSLCDPGEPVGLLAAQVNFHFIKVNFNK